MNADLWALPERVSLPDSVARRFLDAMHAGAVQPGERIIEATLAGRLGVSRGPLREALKALEAGGLVERRGGRGLCVAEVSVERAGQMIVMRATLEGLAARLVAAGADATLRARLAAQHALIEAAAAAGDARDWREQDWRFHEMVCAGSGNAFLLRSWTGISHLIRLFLHHHPGFERDAPEVLRNHARLLRVLRSGDPDLADATFRDVILRSGYRRLGLEPPPEIAALCLP